MSHAMDDDALLDDAFGTAQLWQPSPFFQDPTAFPSSLFAPLQLNVPAIKLSHPYAPKTTLDRELRLPQIDTFDFSPLSDLDSSEISSPSIGTAHLQEDEDRGEDDDEHVWQLALECPPTDQTDNFHDWGLFEGSENLQQRTPYIAESGPRTLDAALFRDHNLIPAGRILKDGVVLASLWNLALGRSSILFAWDAKLRTFVPTISDGRPSGLSLSSAKSLIKRFIVTGNTFLYLRAFIERTFASPSSIPARVALATSVASILSTFERHLGKHSNTVRSVLQLQRLFDKPAHVLLHVSRMIDAVKHAGTNEQLSSILHHRVLELEEGNETLRQLFTEILCRVSKPSLDLMGEWIGLQREQDTLPVEKRGSFVEIEDDADDQRPAEYKYVQEAMPRFVNAEDGSTIFAIGNSLRFLRRHHPDHPLTSLDNHGVAAPELSWKFRRDDIENISAKAKAYEESLKSAILKFANGSVNGSMEGIDAESDPTSSHTPEVTTPEEDLKKYLQESAELFDRAPTEGAEALQDELGTLTTQLLSESHLNQVVQTFSPPISLTSTMSFRPILAVQARLVNAATLRLFFRSHRLRMHLSIQRQYHLLGDGVFSSRLASALFDPERESAERHKGTMRSGVHMGLQVGSRENWPPASSELRLALMGILGESFYTSALYISTVANGPTKDLQASRDKGELPGQLNFAIRQLTETEMEKIMDPDSLYALDFLRLQYVPASPLHLIISASALEKYDNIFKFLLRLLRMLFVVAHLPRAYLDTDSRFFRIEAHHFITAISMYIFQTGIAEHWDAFESYVSSIEDRLAEEDAANESGTRVTAGLEALKSAHESCLDSIMFSLLLRRRQKKVMVLLEEIFDHILLFAKITRESQGAKEGEVKVGAEIKDLYAKLKAKIRVFISVCKGLTGKKGYGKGKGTSEENTLERLGVLLEMNTYYAGGG